MIFDLKNEYQIPKFKEYVNKLFSERAVVEVKKKLPNRTLAQNSYLHLLLGYFGSEYGCSLDEAKIDFYKRTCNRDLFERKTINKKGEEVTYLRSSAELTTGEMTLSIGARHRQIFIYRLLMNIKCWYMPSKKLNVTKNLFNHFILWTNF